MGVLDRYGSDYHILIEQLAAIEHQTWIEYANGRLGHGVKLPWVREQNIRSWMVDYSELPEHIKEDRRRKAVKVLEIIVTKHPVCPICFSFVGKDKKPDLKVDNKDG